MFVYHNCFSVVIEDCLCSIVLPLLFCQRSVECIYIGLFLCYSVLLIYLLILWSILLCLEVCSFIVSLEIELWQPSNFVVLFQYYVIYFGSFASPYKLQNQFVDIYFVRYIICKYFLPSTSCFLVMLMVYFAMQKLLSLMSCHLLPSAFSGK